MLRAALLLCLAGGVAVGEMPTRLLYSRLGPVKTGVFIADGDGGHERALVRPDSLDYNASFSTDGKWIVFTSERNGSADIYRVHPDGEGLERLTEHPAFDDQAALSPDGSMLSFCVYSGWRFCKHMAARSGDAPIPGSGQNQCRKFPAELVA
jgi:TolB protein